MPEYKLSLTLLALFTSKERALEIQGDLLEESRERGKGWFYTNVFLTTFALYLRAFMQAPLKTLLIALVIGEFLFLFIWLGADYINRPFFEFPVYLQWLSHNTQFFFFIFMPIFSYLVGVILTRVAKGSGIKILMTSMFVFCLLFGSMFIYSIITLPPFVDTTEQIGWVFISILYFLGLIALPMLFGGIQIARAAGSKRSRLT